MSAVDTHVGRSVRRVEDLPLITGEGDYGADISRPGELHARVVRSDVPFGHLKSVDASEALARPGVVRVITGEDIPEGKIQIRLFPGPEAMHALQSPLTSDMVRYVGDPVAVVVAEDPYIAEDAAEQVFLDIEPVEALMGFADSISDGATAIHPALGKNIVDGVSVEHGDVAAVFAEAAVVVGNQLRVQRHGAVPMEPRALVAEYEPDIPRVSVWGAAKVKHYNRRALAAMLGMDEESVRLVEGYVGGGFGARGEFYPEDFLIPWLARELGRPVKWVEDRREGLIALNHSRETLWDMEMAADADGNLLGYRGSSWFGQGGYVRTHGSLLLPRVMTSHFPGAFRWQAFEHRAASVLLNKTPAGTYRGPGMVEANFVRERMVDLIADELDADPSDLRRQNLIRPSDFPYAVGVPDIESEEPKVLVEGDFPLTYDRMIERAGYAEVKAEVERRRADGELVGIGISTFIEMPNQGPFERARVTVESDGRFTAHVGVGSVGQGVQTVLAQLTAELLELPVERVEINYHDTDLAPVGLGAFASRATVMGGYAVK
ncbi:MAG: xanthine dehydrogenase family protein molybdopterin-binding subunit, partial [Solirubrobacterales bacterium]